jgi:NADH-quinone oxidoreductase subunit A
MGIEAIILFFTVGLVLVGGAVVFAHFAAPKSINHSKFEAYECGIPVKDGAWTQFNVGYYLFALIYLVFDVEVVFIYPWGVVMKDLGTTAFVEVLIFFFILGLGLAYAWKKKALKWQ